jgi:hypothetical protein
MEALTKYATFYEKMIVENIDFEGYGISNDCYLYDKIKTLYNIFKREFVHKNNQHINEVILFKDWLQGLPSVLTVTFMNDQILGEAKKYGIEIKNEESFLDNYWVNLSKAFFTLKDNL